MVFQKRARDRYCILTPRHVLSPTHVKERPPGAGKYGTRKAIIIINIDNLTMNNVGRTDGN